MILSAMRQALRVYRAQLPAMLRFALLQTVTRLMALAPLLFLTERATRMLALLSLPLYLLIALPMRQNAALAMQEALGGGSIFSMLLVSTRDYGKKLWRGLKTTLLLMLWALPAICATAAGVYLYAAEGVQGKTDAATLLLAVAQLGGGDLMQGLKLLTLIYAATYLPLLAGLAFHCGARHAHALGDARALRGHRARMMGCFFASLVAYLPFMAVCGIAVGTYVPKVVELVMKTFSLDGVASPVPCLLTLGASVVLLLLPALPLRGMMLAACARDAAQSGAEAHGA